jgi:hypothetical protein
MHIERNHPCLVGHDDVVCCKSNSDHVTLASQRNDIVWALESSDADPPRPGEFCLGTTHDTLSLRRTLGG